MRRILVLSVAGVVALGGCSNESSPRSSGTEAAVPARALTPEEQAKVDKAVAVSNGLRSGSEDPDAVLRANGLTEQQFDDLLFEIASDEAMAGAYAQRTGP